MSYLGSDDFIFYKENGKIMSGGYTVNSILLNSGISPMQTNNIGNQTGGKVSSVFENLAVPAGLFYAHPKHFVGEEEINMPLPDGQNGLPTGQQRLPDGHLI